MSFKLYYKGTGDVVYPMEFIPYAKGFKDDFHKVMTQAANQYLSRENNSAYSWYFPLGTVTNDYFFPEEITKPTEDSLIENFIQRIGGSVDFTKDSNIKVIADYNDKLYLDVECTKPSGVSVFVKNSVVAFQFSEIANNNYTIPPYSELKRCFDLFSIQPNNYNNIRVYGESPTKYTDGFKALSFRSPYSNGNDTSLDAFLKNMYRGEKDLYDDDNTMVSSPALSPFNISYLSSAIDSIYYGISMAHPSTMTGVSPSLNAQYNNYASFYTVMKGKPLVAVDEMTFGGKAYRPAVVYRPDMLTAWDNLTYDIANAGTVKTYDIPSGYNQESIGGKNVWAIPLSFVQIGSGYLDSYYDKEALNAFPYSNNSFSGAKAGDDTAKNTFMAINSAARNISLPRYNFMLCQAYPVTNLSKYAQDTADNEVSRIRYGSSDNMIPYIFTVANVYWATLSKWGNTLSNLDAPYNNCTACLAVIPLPQQFSSLTGTEMLNYFYGGKVDDWEPTPPTPSPDIPEDNGNGGFNNSDYLGGNGSWQDTTTDMSYDKNNALWHTPDNLGLDGNYDIVKLNRASVALLASQTWTQDGWLAYLAKMSNISRAGDGIADIKTCFAEIPTTGDANITAIAGFGIKQPIPCKRVNQYNQFDMGTVNVPVYFGSFLDYSPYTEIVLELPFAQPVKIPPEVVVGQNINLTLSVDLMSSSAMYIITCGGRLLAQVPANIFINIPFAASEYSEGAISALAGYIASAGNIGSNVATNTQQKLDKGKAVVNPVSAGFEAAAAPAAAMHEIASRGESRNITQISQGGGGGAIGAMGLKYATLKITRPYVTIPPRYYELQGCPSGFVKRVGDCKGYLEVDQIYGSIPCNTDEFNAIVSQLKGGIFP